MPTLLPRWFTGMASIINIPILRPSLYRHEVGNHIKFTRLHLGSLALRPISLSFRNSRPLIAQTPLLRTTKAYGQLLGRDFNPLAKLLLLRTSGPKTQSLISTQLHARAYVATPISSISALIGTTNSTRAWLEFGVGF